MQRFLYPLKELGQEGCHYLVFLEDFPDTSVVPRSFTVRSEGAGFGLYGNVRANLLRSLEVIDEGIDVAQRVILTVEDECMNCPERQRRLKQILKTAESLKEIDEGLEQLVSSTSAELAEYR
jgi:hypothetical protein